MCSKYTTHYHTRALKYLIQTIFAWCETTKQTAWWAPSVWLISKSQPSITRGQVNRVPAFVAGVEVGCVHLCWVAGNTAWSVITYGKWHPVAQRQSFIKNPTLRTLIQLIWYYDTLLKYNFNTSHNTYDVVYHKNDITAYGNFEEL